MSKVKFTNVWEIVTNSDYFLYIFIGGRGIGKTYSSLKGSRLDHKRIMYVRRTATEIDNCVDEFTNPYKALNQDMGWNIYIEKRKDNSIILEENGEDTEVIGYACPLSTFGKFRGADFSDVDVIIFDEFINTNSVNTLKDEAKMFFNLIETVNRNRELREEESIKIILLSNANTLDNDILRSLMLGDVFYSMKVLDQEVYTDDERGLYLSLLKNDDVKDMKSKTKLYKLTQGTAFFDMAINNEFTTDYFGDVNKVKYTEMVPLCMYDKLCFYKHKSKDLIFVSYRKANCTRYDTNTLKAFKREYGYMIQYYIDTGQILYSDYNVKLEVKGIYK